MPIVAQKQINTMSTTTKSTVVANATFTKPVKGFTYVRDYAAITVDFDGKSEKIIIGSKAQFPISDMFQLKQAETITIREIEPRTVNEITYRRFVLESINF